MLKYKHIKNLMDFKHQPGFFQNRIQAGKDLAEFLKNIKGEGAVVYALPRGGVVVGAEIAKAIKAPLDLIIARKIGHPLSSEYAIGAVTENGHSILNREEIRSIDKQYIQEETQKQRLEAKRRRLLYVGERQSISCEGKVAILVDDGIATGLTLKAAIAELKAHYQPKEIIVAVPVAPKSTVLELEAQGIKVVALLADEQFLGAIGAYYQDFSPVDDKDVQKILFGFDR